MWNIISKDLVRLRMALLAWVGLLVIKVMVYAVLSGSFGPPHVEWLGHMSSGPMVAIRACTEPLIAFLLVGLMVYEDPLAGSDAFWVTRPISGARLLGAKALGTTLLFVAIPILVNIPWWLSCGFGPVQVAHAALPMAIEYGSVVVIGVGIASATTSFPRYFLWTIAGLAGLVALHLMASEIARTGLGFQDLQTIGTSIAITRLVVLFACALLLCAEIGLYQFLSRHLRKSLFLVTGFTVLSSMAVFSTHTDFFPGLAWDRQAYGQPLERNSAVGMAVPAGTAGTSTYDGFMFVPLKLTGIGPGISAYWQAQAEWSSRGQSIWKIGGIGGRYQYDLMEEKTASLLGFSKDLSEFACGENFQFPRPLAKRYTGQPLSFHATFYIYLLKGSLVADQPVVEQGFKSAGASFWVTDLEENAHSVSATVTDRFERLTPFGFMGAVWPRSISWALVNRSKGERIAGREAYGANMVGVQLNMVTVVVVRMTFPKIPSAEWLKGARLVAFDFEGDHNVEQTLDENPFRYSYVSAEDSRYKYKKAH